MRNGDLGILFLRVFIAFTLLMRGISIFVRHEPGPVMSLSFIPGWFSWVFLAICVLCGSLILLGAFTRLCSWIAFAYASLCLWAVRGSVLALSVNYNRDAAILLAAGLLALCFLGGGKYALTSK